jgi:hypothetical protein
MSLVKIQNELKAPKSQFNKFGGYHYRNCEDILEALKPLLLKYDAAMTIKDDIVLIGERYYIKATVTLHIEDFQAITNTAFARESLDKKGMDDSQITGTSSSYARKYALNGLFLIDDTKDADSMDNTKEEKPKPTMQKAESDEKPWYNDFEAHKDLMIEGIKSGEKTAEIIITNLEKTYKLSNKTKDLIKGIK